MVNLFWLSPPRYVRGRGLNYSWCARQHIDAHIVKIPLEAAQLLYAAHHALPAADDWRTRAPMAGTGERGYRPTHMNNPISKWVRESAAHYRHAVAYGLALCEEYSHRYGREHACEAHLHWLKGHEPAIPDVDDHPDDDDGEDEVARFRIARAPPCAMPDEFKVAPLEEAAVAAEAKEEPDAGSAEADGGEEEVVVEAARPLQRSKGKEKVATIKKEEEDQADDDDDGGGGDGGDDEARRIIAEAELVKKRRREKEEAEEEEEEAVEEEVKTIKVEVELQTTQGDVALITTETLETTTTTTTATATTASAEAAAEEEEERVEDLLRPIEDEVAASEVAFPLHVYQSYRAYYLGQKLSLKMSTFKTRDVPHWAQERVLEIGAQPKPAPVKKEKKKTTTTTRTRRTTTTTAAKRKRGQAKAAEAGEGDEDEAAGDEDYTEGRLTRSRTRKATQAKLEQDEGEKNKKKTKRSKNDEEQQQEEGGQEKKRKTLEAPDSGEAVPPVRRSPRTSKARPTTSSTPAEAALSKRRKVAKELK